MKYSTSVCFSSSDSLALQWVSTYRLGGMPSLMAASIPSDRSNAGHPGGTLPLTESSAETLHDARLPRNVYVADASLFTHALGNPPSLTIMALALRASRAAAARLA